MASITRIEQLVHQPYGSLCAPLSTYSGQNYGAGRMDRVRLGMKHGLGVSFVFTLLMFLIRTILYRKVIRSSRWKSAV